MVQIADLSIIFCDGVIKNQDEIVGIVKSVTTVFSLRKFPSDIDELSRNSDRLTIDIELSTN